jgi:hypothetical protein
VKLRSVLDTLTPGSSAWRQRRSLASLFAVRVIALLVLLTTHRHKYDELSYLFLWGCYFTTALGDLVLVSILDYFTLTHLVANSLWFSKWNRHRRCRRGTKSSRILPRCLGQLFVPYQFEPIDLNQLRSSLLPSHSQPEQSFSVLN